MKNEELPAASGSVTPYVMADIHGDKQRFDAMLKLIDLYGDPNNHLYILGDVLDRGPHGIAILQEIMKDEKMTLILGNHELMALRSLAVDSKKEEWISWSLNHSEKTRESFFRLSLAEQRKILEYLETCPSFLEIELNGTLYHLVHGFPGDTVRQRVWGRPDSIYAGNPLDGSKLIIGHTPIPLLLCKNGEEQEAYLRELESREDHIHIFHANEFIDIDTGCGYNVYGACLSCLRLTDMAEFYVL